MRFWESDGPFIWRRGRTSARQWSTRPSIAGVGISTEAGVLRAEEACRWGRVRSLRLQRGLVRADESGDELRTIGGCKLPREVHGKNHPRMPRHSVPHLIFFFSFFSNRIVAPDRGSLVLSQEKGTGALSGHDWRLGLTGYDLWVELKLAHDTQRKHRKRNDRLSGP